MQCRCCKTIIISCQTQYELQLWPHLCADKRMPVAWRVHAAQRVARVNAAQFMQAQHVSRWCHL
jgi:hypothetical protein